MKQNSLQDMLANVGDVSFRRRILNILDFLDLNDDDIVLDCGCGEGFYVKLLSELYNCKIVGLDHDLELLEVAKRRVGNRDNVGFQFGDINHLPFDDETFDKIILSEVLEHISDDERALQEVYRVLKKGGVLALTVPNHDYPFFWDPLNKIREVLGLGHFSKDRGFWGGIWAMHLRLYFPDEIKTLVEKTGFKIEEIKALTHYCLPFNHNILYFFKQVHNRVPLPKGIYDSMDKFAWETRDEKRRRVSLSPIPLAMKVINAVDKKNDSFNDLEKSSMCIALKAVKE